VSCSPAGLLVLYRSPVPLQVSLQVSWSSAGHLFLCRSLCRSPGPLQSFSFCPDGALFKPDQILQDHNQTRSFRTTTRPDPSEPDPQNQILQDHNQTRSSEPDPSGPQPDQILQNQILQNHNQTRSFRTGPP
ncbi:Sodium- and chloride-dependent betaine transporter, partial [Dissostichus eleginoides]